MSDEIRETGGPQAFPGARRIPSARQGVLILTGPVREARILFVNADAVFITGFPATEMEGRGLRFFLDADEDPAEMDRLCAAMEEGRPASVVLRCARKNGAAFRVTIDVDPVRDAGRVVYFIATLQDASVHETPNGQVTAEKR